MTNFAMNIPDSNVFKAESEDVDFAIVSSRTNYVDKAFAVGFVSGYESVVYINETEVRALYNGDVETITSIEVTYTSWKGSNGSRKT